LKNPQISDFMIILAVGAELFRADREKNRHDENNSRFFSKSAFRLVPYLWVTRNSKKKEISVVGLCNEDNMFSVRYEST
jgi:hypothetical protein